MIMVEHLLPNKKELGETPFYYLDQLIREDEPSALFYQYGPYLVIYHIDYFENHLADVKDELMYLLVQATRIIYAHKIKGLSYRDAKKRVVNIMRESCNAYFANTIREIGIYYLKELQKTKQERDECRESAILNYAPIVPYGTVIPKYAETIQKESEVPSYKELDARIYNLFIRNIVDIILHADKYIPPEATQTNYLFSMKQCENACKTAYGEYFFYVYMRYIIPKDQYEMLYQQFLKINTIYNKITNGERIDVAKAIEAFSYVSPL